MSRRSAQGARPPFDCRITAECLRSDLRLRLPQQASFADLRRESALVDVFCERATVSCTAGDDAVRIKGLGRPVYTFNYGPWIGATWFDTPVEQAKIVWLLGVLALAAPSDPAPAEREFIERNRQGRLYPQEVDYVRLELDIRKRDTADFAEAVRHDARALMERAVDNGVVEGEIARIPVTVAWRVRDEVLAMHVALSTKPVIGRLGGYAMPLDADRFQLCFAALNQAAEGLFGTPTHYEDIEQWVPELQDLAGTHRGFILVFERPRR